MEKNIENYFFLEGDGECASLARSTDWASTAIGDPENWPHGLRNTVALVLSSEFPMLIFWGDELVQLYNDAFRPSLGNSGKHPAAMGQRGEDCWPEIWDFINPLIRQVMSTGKGVWYENLLLPIYRNGRMEDAYWTFSYSAVRGDTGKIEGVLVVCNETTDKILSLKGLNENKAQLEFAIEAAELGTWDLNPVTGKFSSNDRLKHWFGLQPEDEVPLTMATDVIAERDRQKVLDAIEFALNPASGGRYEIGYTIIHPLTKSERHVLAKGIAKFDETGRAYRFNGTLQDITKDKVSQQRITEARQLTDLAVKSVGIGIFKVNFTDNSIEYTPEFAAIMTGDKNKKDFTRRTFIKHIHPEDESMRAEALRAANETGEFHYTPRVVWDDGSIHRIAVTGASIKDINGELIAFSGTVRDITFQESQHLALEDAERRYSVAQRESEALLLNITKSSPTGLWLSDTDGGLTYLNKTLVDWTGMEYEALLGTGWANAVIEEDRQRSAETFMDALAQRKHYDVLFRIKKADGSIVWCRAAGDPYFDDNGEYAGYSGFCMDMDEIMSGRKIIAEREALFRSIVEQAPVATCLFTGPEMKVEVANDIMLGYWGKDSSVIGMPLAQAVPELRGQSFLQVLDDVFTTGITYEEKASAAILNVGGVAGTYYFDFTYKPLRNADGTIYGVMDMAIDVTEQVIARQKLIESESFVRHIFYNSPVAKLVYIGEEMILREANEAMLKIFGRDESILHKPIMESIPELRQSDLFKKYRRVMETGEPHFENAQQILLIKNGQEYWGYYDYIYKPLRNSQDEIYGIVCTIVDVTKQVLTQQEIEKEQKRVIESFEESPVGIATIDAQDLTFVSANKFYGELVGRLPKDIVNRPLLEAIPELAGQGFDTLLKSVIETGIPFIAKEVAVSLMRNELLETIYVDLTYQPRRDSENSIIGVLIVATDVTQQVLTRRKIEASEAALHNAIELAELSTWKLDIKNNVFIYSKRFMEWLGFSEDTKNIGEAYNPLPEEYRESVPAAVAEAIKHGGTGIYDNEHPIVNRVTGQTRIIHANAQVLYDNLGNPEFLSGTAQDVTKERKLQQELEFLVEKRTEELRGANEELEMNNLELQQFAYIASHDLQEPVRKIAVYMQMLEMSIGEINEKSRDYIDKINNSAQRMTNLVRDVLGFSQLSGAAAEFQTVDLNDLTQEIIAEFELIIDEKNASVKHDELPVIEGIPLQLSQLFGNLISNALKYVPTDINPEIYIKSMPAASEDLLFSGVLPDVNYHKLVFSDNGIGFDQLYAEKIFNIFQRLHGKNDYMGTGIGLAMCKKIVQNHHGSISAKSELGKGAEFTVLLPETQGA